MVVESFNNLMTEIEGRMSMVVETLMEGLKESYKVRHHPTHPTSPTQPPTHPTHPPMKNRCKRKGPRLLLGRTRLLLSSRVRWIGFCRPALALVRGWVGGWVGGILFDSHAPTNPPTHPPTQTATLIRHYLDIIKNPGDECYVPPSTTISSLKKENEEKEKEEKEKEKEVGSQSGWRERYPPCPQSTLSVQQLIQTAFFPPTYPPTSNRRKKRSSSNRPLPRGTTPLMW